MEVFTIVDAPATQKIAVSLKEEILWLKILI
jgi:hypothetical protein